MFERLPIQDGRYRTEDKAPSLLARLSPTVAFYALFAEIVFRWSSVAKQGRYGTEEWSNSSLEVLRVLERVGVRFDVDGVEHYMNVGSPCVFISNHMSALETFVIPCLIAPYMDLTFIIKRSLVEYPVVKHVIRARDPITVTRTNPREDLRAVLEGGTARLRAGRSIAVFPQTTRSDVFDVARFNTIGVKLAKKADVPVVPVALKTDAWGNGRFMKDFGKIDPSKRVFFSFGKPLTVDDRGAAAHEAVIQFILSKLSIWGAPAGKSD